MAATLGKDQLIGYFPHVIEEAYYTTLVPGATVIHTLKNQINAAPFKIECITVQKAASSDPVFFVWDESANVLTAGANTVALQFDTVAGGDLTDAEVKVLIYHIAQAAGGISA